MPEVLGEVVERAERKDPEGDRVGVRPPPLRGSPQGAVTPRHHDHVGPPFDGRSHRGLEGRHRPPEPTRTVLRRTRRERGLDVLSRWASAWSPSTEPAPQLTTTSICTTANPTAAPTPPAPRHAAAATRHPHPAGRGSTAARSPVR